MPCRRFLAWIAFALTTATACAGTAPSAPLQSEPSPILAEPLDDTRVLLLGGSYVRSAAPAIVSAFGSRGVEVLDASENGLMVGQFDSLLYDWRAEYGAYIDALAPDAVVISVPIGLEAFNYCQTSSVDSMRSCLDERIAGKVVDSATELAEFFVERDVEMLFYGDVSIWPGPGRYDGRSTELDAILLDAMIAEEVALASTFADYGFPFVSVRTALTGPRTQFWVQEQDGYWYNWRFPETGNVHWCPRGAAHLAVLLAPYVAEGLVLSMTDDWVDDAWNYDSWYLHRGCATEPSPHPRYLPVAYDEADIGRTPMAGFTEEVRSVVVPGDQEVCATLAESALERALDASTPVPLGGWSVAATLRPKWHEFAVVTDERMQWTGGCRYSLLRNDALIDHQSHITVVEWEESEDTLTGAFVRTGHTVHPASTSRTTLFVPPPPEAGEMSSTPPGAPVAAIVATGDRVFTVHSPIWPTVAVLRSAQLEARLAPVELNQFLQWFDDGTAASDVAAALVELATSLEP